MLGKHFLALPGKDNLQKKLNRLQQRLQYMEQNEKTVSEDCEISEDNQILSNIPKD